MNEIKLNKFHYKLNPQSGFWVSQLPTDPMSATVTIDELCYMLRDSVNEIKKIVTKIECRITEVENFIEYHS